jgi:hypothetical protein
MGLFSLFKKESKPVVVPSLEEQFTIAKQYVDSFLDEIFDGFNKDNEDDFDCAKFRIAGISNYCSNSDIGIIKGVTFPQNNPYDKTAIALGKIINGSVNALFGYIAKDDKKEFNKFADDNKQRPFIGYIREFFTEEGRRGIMGVVKIYKGNGSNLYQQMIKDTQLIQGVFKGYYNDAPLEEGEKIEWILDRHF